MEKASAYRTKTWTRSPRGEIFGVATGLAEWRGLPPRITRLIVFIACCVSNFVGVIVYLFLALFLPMQTERDLIHTPSEDQAYASNNGARYSGKSQEELKKEYEELKKKVETMENEMFNREKDWDNRFDKE